MWQCNLGKVNLKAMLFGSLWMQATQLQPWWFAGTLWDGYMQQPAPANQLKLGVAQAPRRAPRDPYMQFAAWYHSQGSFRWHLCSQALQFLPGSPLPLG